MQITPVVSLEDVNSNKSGFFVLLLPVRVEPCLSICLSQNFPLPVICLYVCALYYLLFFHVIIGCSPVCIYPAQQSTKVYICTSTFFHYRYNHETCFSIVCFLKRTKNFINRWIHAMHTIWSSRDIPHSLFSFFYPISLIPPTSSAIGSNPTHLCGFRRILVIVSGRHGSDGSTLARVLLFSVCLVNHMQRSSFPL